MQVMWWCDGERLYIREWTAPCVVKRLKKGNLGQHDARPLKGLTRPFFHRERESEREVGGMSWPIGMSWCINRAGVAHIPRVCVIRLCPSDSTIVRWEQWVSRACVLMMLLQREDRLFVSVKRDVVVLFHVYGKSHHFTAIIREHHWGAEMWGVFEEKTFCSLYLIYVFPQFPSSFWPLCAHVCVCVCTLRFCLLTASIWISCPNVVPYQYHFLLLFVQYLAPLDLVTRRLCRAIQFGSLVEMPGIL